MTAIVYRAGIIAADSLVTANDLRVGSALKIIRTRGGWLAGGSGDLSSVALFFEWMQAGHRSGDMEAVGAVNSIDGIAVSPGGEVFSVDGRGVLSPVECEYLVAGSGREVALGALGMGATAEQAVAEAIRHHIACGPPVVTLQLKDGRAWRRNRRK